MATSQKLEVALSAVPRFPPDELTAPYGDQNTHWSAHSSWARPRDFQSWVVEPVNVIGQVCRCMYLINGRWCAVVWDEALGSIDCREDCSCECGSCSCDNRDCGRGQCSRRE